VPQSAGPTTLAIAIAALLAVLPFVAIAVVNIVMAVRGWTPLTQLVENYMRRYPIFAAVLAGFVGALAGHVFWSFGDNPAGPPATLHLLPWAVVVAVAAGMIGAVLLVVIAYGLDLIFGQSTAEGERPA
jgi:hypothetical protein